MAGRSPVRFLAPLALVAFAIALYLIVDRTRNDEEPASSGTQQEQTADASPTPEGKKDGGKKKDKKPKTYTVEAGDTPSGIAEDAGITLEELLELNPELDPQALTPGTELKLR